MSKMFFGSMVRRFLERLSSLSLDRFWNRVGCKVVRLLLFR